MNGWVFLYLRNDLFWGRSQCFTFRPISAKRVNSLQFPPYDLKIRQTNGKAEVWDALRKMWLVLTPEEWVRQHLIFFLQKERNFPAGLMTPELSLKVNGMSKRADLVVYDKSATPILLAECKAPEVSINQAVFDQASRYNITAKVPYLLVTNGLKHYCSRIDFETGTFSFLPDIPLYEDLKRSWLLMVSK